LPHLCDAWVRRFYCTEQIWHLAKNKGLDLCKTPKNCSKQQKPDLSSAARKSKTVKMPKKSYTDPGVQQNQKKTLKCPEKA